MAAIKSACGITFECLLHDGGQRLFAHKKFSVSADGFIAITKRCFANPIAIHQARAHAVLDLLGIFLALMLGNAGKKIFNEYAVGILTEFYRRRFKFAASLSDCTPEFKMGFNSARKSADIVNDDDDLLRFMLPQKFQHVLHAGSIRHASRDAFIGKRFYDIVFLKLRIFSATGILGF